MLKDHAPVLKAIIDEACNQYLYDPRPYLTPPQVHHLRDALPVLIAEHPWLHLLGPTATHLFSLAVWGKSAARYLFRGKHIKGDYWNVHLLKPDGDAWDPLANTRAAACAVLSITSTRPEECRVWNDERVKKLLDDAPKYQNILDPLEVIARKGGLAGKRIALKELLGQLLPPRSGERAINDLRDLIWRCWRFEEALRSDLSDMGHRLLVGDPRHLRQQWDRYLPMLLAGITLWWTPGKKGGKRNVEGLCHGWTKDSKGIPSPFPYNDKCWGLSGDKMNSVIDTLIRHREALADGTMTAAAPEMEGLVSHDILTNSLFLRFVAGGVILSPNTSKLEKGARLNKNTCSILNDERREKLGRITEAARICGCKAWELDQAQVTASFWWRGNTRNNFQPVRIIHRKEAVDLQMIPVPKWGPVGDFLRDLPDILGGKSDESLQKYMLIIRAIESGRLVGLQGTPLIEALAREPSLDHLRRYREECQPTAEQFRKDCMAVGLP